MPAYQTFQIQIITKEKREKVESFFQHLLGGRYYPETDVRQRNAKKNKRI